ncbi:substrate-binding periplasmic protein [Planctobacterium marinum]|uniref:substrate-binding periplasmic protein n=1 Tax=Planctobacterium marinum TaxID=1631968 RepID=UPI001E3D305B|nr:transporter substrate-binding domain-containing protein [Planctobacterium marinum]MCC2606342.1 transporter substrate-binding domain-containing protein [Planctobacterium marinum]
MLKRAILISQVLFGLVSLSLLARETPTLSLCIDHYPPLQIVLENGLATGENVEVARQFAQNLGYQLTFTTDIPFKRCLQWLEDGEVDLMIGLLDSAQRQQNYHMFLYDDHTIKRFFIRNEAEDILDFSDLAGLNIAVVRGARQFDLFDNAPGGYFNRVAVNTLPAAFGMLAKGRVDAVVCTDYYGTNIVKSHPEFTDSIKQASYQVINGTKVYIALSRQSEFAFDAQRMNQKAIEMYLSGEFEQLMQTFQRHNPQWY